MSSGVAAGIVCLIALGFFVMYVGSTSPQGLEAGGASSRFELRQKLDAIQSAKREGFINYQNRELASWNSNASRDFDEMLENYKTGTGYWWARLMDSRPELFPI